MSTRKTSAMSNLYQGQRNKRGNYVNLPKKKKIKWKDKWRTQNRKGVNAPTYIF